MTPTLAATGFPPVFDGHNDALTRLYLPWTSGSFLERRPEGHLDLPRALEGGFAGGLFAIMPKAPPSPADLEEPPPGDGPGYSLPLDPPLDPGIALESTLAAMGGLFRLERQAGGRLKVVTTAVDLQGCLEAGVLAVVLHFEGAEAIDPDLRALEVFHRAGLRSLGLVWSRPNAFGQGVPFCFPSSPDIGPGLTEAGRRLVRACNELGILLDLSHLNEAGFWEVAGLSRAPLVASHSNAHALCPVSRNLTDAQLDAVAASGGLVGVNLAVSFLRPDGRNEADTPLEVVLDHVEYLAGRMGVRHVALGSDFDGATIPREVGDVTGLPRLLEGLRRRGWSDEELALFCYGNWLRVLRQTWGR
ncbi:MAG TPA: dipeptidase [Candidatus Nitrosotenuis sp.]|jgi:membrane dipeptidase|nr:dipeptidase [Candidatus Nitrosotenuis sp.]